jgi:hypothetical protein
VLKLGVETKNRAARTSFPWVPVFGHLRRMKAGSVAGAGQNCVWRKFGFREVLYFAPDCVLQKLQI